jgi:hypothetical protein
VWVAGLGAIEQLRRRSVTPTMDVTVMAIRAEGVSWFPAPYIGSRAAFGILPEDVLDSVVRLRIDGMKLDDVRCALEARQHAPGAKIK